MKRILVTRYGGHGDLLMLEPVIESIYYHWMSIDPEVEITLRTYKDYVDDMKFHPMIRKIIVDDMSYQSGHFYGCGTAQPDDEYDMVYDFQGVIEKSKGVHGIDAFAALAGTPVLRREPAFFIDPDAKSLGPSEVLFCNRTASDRQLDENLLKELGLERDYMRQPVCSSIHDFAATICDARLVVTVDSAAAHLCAALSVPSIVIYDERFPPLTRRYPWHKWVMSNNMDHLPDMIESELSVDRESPNMLNNGDAGRGFKIVAHSYMSNPFVDVGPDKWPLVGAVGATEQTRKMVLENVPDEHFGGIYSSHCLEHIDDWQSELRLWDRKCKKGAVLALYLPHPCFEPWLPGGSWVGPWHRWAPEPVTLVKWLNENTRFQVFEYSVRADAMKSFYILAIRS